MKPGTANPCAKEHAFGTGTCVDCGALPPIYALFEGALMRLRDIVDEEIGLQPADLNFDDLLTIIERELFKRRQEHPEGYCESHACEFSAGLGHPHSGKCPLA